MSDFRTNATGRKPRPLSGIALHNARRLVCKYGHPRSGDNLDKWNRCRKCVARRTREWAARNPEKVAQYAKKTKRIHYQAQNYGLTPIQYEYWVQLQHGVCAICGSPETKKNKQRLSIDHKHGTTIVRGLLCDSCNNGLSKFRDNPDILRSAAEYLEAAQILESISLLGEEVR